jgi:hypothetical protein
MDGFPVGVQITKLIKQNTSAEEALETSAANMSIADGADA